MEEAHGRENWGVGIEEGLILVLHRRRRDGVGGELRGLEEGESRGETTMVMVLVLGVGGRERSDCLPLRLMKHSLPTKSPSI